MELRHKYNFSGGQQNVSTDEARGADTALALINVMCRRQGGVQRRTGFRRVLTSTGGAIGLGQASLVASSVLTNFLFQISATTITRAAIQTDGSTVSSNLSVSGGDPTYTTFVRTVSMLGTLSTVVSKYVFFIGSGEVPITYDGGNVTRQVLAVPGAPTVATGVAGVLTGAYTYRITFVNDFGESSGGTISTTVNPAAEKVDISAIPLGSTTEPYAVRWRRIYRTDAGGSTYKLLTTLTDNTTTTYTDNTADGSLGTTAPTINRTSTIPRGVDGAVYQSRLFITNNADGSSQGANLYPYRVWFSKVDDGLNFNNVDQNGTYVGYFDIPTFEATTGMGVAGNRLIIFTARSMFAWDGYRVTEVSRAIGTPYGATIAQGDQQLYFLDFSGVYRFDGGTPQLVSHNVDPSIQAIADFTTCYGAVHDRAYYLVVGTMTSALDNISFTNSMLVYDEEGGRWTTWDLNVSSVPKTVISYAYRQGNTIQAPRLFIGFNGNSLFQESPTIYTDGTTTGGFTAAPIQWSVTTGPMFGSDPYRMKRNSKIILKTKFGAGTNLFYRVSRDQDYGPLGTANGDTLERTVPDTPERTPDGYFTDLRVVGSERGVPTIVEGFTYAVSDESEDIAEY